MAVVAGAALLAPVSALVPTVHIAVAFGWPAGLALFNIAWGSLLTMACAAAGKWAMDRVGSD